MEASSALAVGDLTTARRLGEESWAVFRELGDRWGQLRAIDVLAVVAEVTGDYDEATRLHREGLRSAEELGLWTEASYELSGLGRQALLAGDYAASEDLHRRAMELAAGQSHQRVCSSPRSGWGWSPGGRVISTAPSITSAPGSSGAVAGTATTASP